MFGGSGSGDHDPFKEFESMLRNMGRFGGPMFPTGTGSAFGNSSFSRIMGNGGTFESNSRGAFTPAATVTDTGSEYQLDVDVPGIPRDELKVTATAQKLCVSGQRRTALSDMMQSASQQQQQQQGAAGENKQHQQPRVFPIMDERGAGFFERCFSFPEKISEDKITAHSENGVLSVCVGHAGKQSSKEISIR